MNYKECFDNIVKEIKEKEQLQPLSFSMNLELNESDYNKCMDLINFLISRCTLRFGYLKGMNFAVALTLTRLGREQFKDELKCENLLSEFKNLYDVENES